MGRYLIIHGSKSCVKCLGAACSSVNPGRSHVLEAMAVDPMLSRCAVRISLGDSLRDLFKP